MTIQNRPAAAAPPRPADRTGAAADPPGLAGLRTGFRRPPARPAPPSVGTVKRTAARWIAAHPAAGLGAGAALGAAVGWFLKRR